MLSCSLWWCISAMSSIPFLILDPPSVVTDATKLPISALSQSFVRLPHQGGFRHQSFRDSQVRQGSVAIPPGFPGIPGAIEYRWYMPKKKHLKFSLPEPPKVHLLYPQLFQGIQVLYACPPQKIQNLLLFSRTSQGSFDIPPGFPGNSGAICPEPPQKKNTFLLAMPC